MSTTEPFTLAKLIEMAYEQRASDLFLKVGAPPFLKRNSIVEPFPGDYQPLSQADLERLVRGQAKTDQIERFEQHHELDFSFSVGELCRVRANCYKQRGAWAMACRVIPLTIRSIEELGLPDVLKELTKHRLGLVLVTGPTGCGKTTTLASMIDLINRTRQCHIVTIEDPLEFLHRDQCAYVSQREIGIDTEDFQPALRSAVREAPDVILIGEMRDTTTMGIAMQAGETGHLVFSTVHTASAYETLDRIINMFPPHEKKHLCQRLAGSLRAIVSQKLIPRADGEGRVVAVEVLICTPTISKCIEEGTFSDIYHHMNEGSFWGMQTMNQSLLKHVKAGLVTEQVAMNHAGIASELKQMLRR